MNLGEMRFISICSQSMFNARGLMMRDNGETCILIADDITDWWWQSLGQLMILRLYYHSFVLFSMFYMISSSLSSIGIGKDQQQKSQTIAKKEVRFPGFVVLC